MSPTKVITVSLITLTVFCCRAKNDVPKITFDSKIIFNHKDLSSLRDLELRYKIIGVLKTGTLQNLPRLSKIKFEYDGIEEIQPEFFRNIPELNKVSLQANNIQQIPEGVFNNSKISILYLGNNSISYIAPKAFDDMPHLNVIQLNNNTLKFWNTNWFRNSPNVEFILFQFNQIKSLPGKAFWNIRRSPYIHIDLSYNEIEFIDSAAFEGLGTLEVLHLDYNKITNLQDGLLINSRKLEYITLGNNLLVCFSDTFLNTLVKRVDLRIENNPMDCRCLRDLERWAKNQKAFSDTAAKAEEEFGNRCNNTRYVLSNVTIN